MLGNEKKAQPMSMNISSIQGYTLLVNQARAQGSKGPPEHATDIASS